MGAFDGFFGRIDKWDIKEKVKMADNLGPMAKMSCLNGSRKSHFVRKIHADT